MTRPLVTTTLRRMGLARRPVPVLIFVSAITMLPVSLLGRRILWISVRSRGRGRRNRGGRSRRSGRRRRNVRITTVRFPFAALIRTVSPVAFVVLLAALSLSFGR
jgi:hypothetical protein